MNTDYSVTYINDRRRLEALCERLITVPVLALDIETASWWDRRAERITHPARLPRRRAPAGGSR